MTRSFRVNRRKAVALTLALASTSAFAITGPAQAELGPNVPAAGDARVTPDGPLTDGFSLIDGLDQPAPVIALGADDQSAAGAQIRIHNQWRSGDRVLFQVRASDGENCADVPSSIGYSSTLDDEGNLVAPTVVSSDVAYEFAGDSPMALNGAPNAVFSADDPVEAADTVPQVKPEFQVNLLSSTQCSPNGITDIIEILFTNQSAPLAVAADPGPAPDAPPADATPEVVAAYEAALATWEAAVVAFDTYLEQVTAAWVLSIDDIAYDVGTNVTAGPLRNLPLAQDATATPGVFINSPGGWFGGNLAAVGATPLVQQLWTTTAFIVPVSLTAATEGVLINDGFNQNLGTITLAESRANGLVDGKYQVCYSGNIGQISTLPTATGPVVEDSIEIIGGNCIRFDVDATAGSDTIVLSNIIGTVVGAGAVGVSLTSVPGDFETAYLMPTDNSVSASVNSDVNVVQAPYLTAPLAVAQALPDRIGGNDRFETAAKIAYSTTQCADFVVLVNGNSYPDSLSASYLAGALSVSSDNMGYWYDDRFFDAPEIPILTTRGTSLSPAAELAIRELGVRTVYIVGGTAAVSADVAAVVDELPRARCGGSISDTTQTVEVERIAGADRYATNQQVVQRAQSILDNDDVNYNARIRYQSNAGESSQRTALLASGEDFADAMSAGPISYGDDEYGFPLVLTNPDTLSARAASTLANIDIDQVIVVGGPAAVSADVVASLEALGIDVIRIAGENRYETSIQVLLWAATPEFPNTSTVLVGGEGFNLGLNWPIEGDVVLARGDDFADALAVAPYVASDSWTPGCFFGGPIFALNGDYDCERKTQDMLVLTTPTSLHPAAGGFISTLASLGLNPNIVAIGLGEAISGNVLVEANALANP